MKTNIIVNLQVEGLHAWPDCDIDRAKYLRNTHRHLFWITAKKEVTDDDRQIEIICFKREISDFLTQQFRQPCDFGTMSCEMIARFLMHRFDLNYCRVLEDGENGAEVQL